MELEITFPYFLLIVLGRIEILKSVVVTATCCLLIVLGRIEIRILVSSSDAIITINRTR